MIILGQEGLHHELVWVWCVGVVRVWLAWEGIRWDVSMHVPTPYHTRTTDHARATPLTTPTPHP